MKTIVIPTPYLPTRAIIPDDYPVPPIGSDFYINYENYIPPEDWPEVFRLLCENVLTVLKVKDGEIYLHKGAVPDLEYEDTEECKALFVAYWILHPETRPPGF